MVFDLNHEIDQFQLRGFFYPMTNQAANIMLQQLHKLDRKGEHITYIW